jgi:putative transposase
MEAFTNAAVVSLTLSQILRACPKTQFEILLYCFMPDHLHLLVEGMADQARLKGFARLAKQYSAYAYSRSHGRVRLWQKGLHDHIVRDRVDLFQRIDYVVSNPVVAGLVATAADYPFWGSERWTRDELLAWVRHAGPPPYPGVHLDR